MPTCPMVLGNTARAAYSVTSVREKLLLIIEHCMPQQLAFDSLARLCHVIGGESREHIWLSAVDIRSTRTCTVHEAHII